MSTSYFLFHGRLNDFLLRSQKGREFSVEFQGQQSIKHLAESLGVPHPEIGQVQVNGQDEALDSIAHDGDRVEIHPIQDGCPIEPRFVLDCHLGRLTAHLRMLGFDCLYENDFDDLDMAQIAHAETRILLTRDRRLLMRKLVEYGYCLRSLDPFEQLTEIIERFDLAENFQPFHRCLHCNHTLERVEKSAILDRLEPMTRQYFDEFHICPACEQIYWKGSHYDQMQKFIEGIRKK